MQLAVTSLIPDFIKEYTENLKKRHKKPVSVGNDLLCMARTIDGKQCSRKKNSGHDLCKPHLAKLSNGRIDDAAIHHLDESIPEDIETHPLHPLHPLPEIKDKKVDSKPQRRGRKSTISFDPRQYDSEYITLWEDIVEGEKVLIDNNNNVYTFDTQNPVYIGKKDVNIKLNIPLFMEKLKTHKENTNQSM